MVVAIIAIAAAVIAIVAIVNNASAAELAATEGRIMSAISDYVAANKTFLDEISTAVDEQTAAIGGIATDVTHLKSVIDKLQNTPGTITPEDQALLDQAQAEVNALSAKAKAAAQAAKDLDAATEVPPTPPTEPPTEPTPV